MSISAVLSVLDYFPIGKLKNVIFLKYSRSDEFTGVAWVAGVVIKDCLYSFMSEVFIWTKCICLQTILFVCTRIYAHYEYRCHA